MSHSTRGQTEFVVQRRVVRWMGAAVALTALGFMVLVGCMWAWMHRQGADSLSVDVLLIVSGLMGMAGGMAAAVAAMWAR
jgi:hypothetical protein